MNLHSVSWRASVGGGARLAKVLTGGESLLRAGPLALAAAYFLLLAIGFGSIVHAFYTNSDVASGPVIGQLYADVPSGTTVVLGNHPWYTTVWFELLTRGFPLRRQLWEVGPWIASLAGIGLVAWSTAKAAGQWAAAFAAFVLACAGPALLAIQFSGTGHGEAVAHVCLLNAFLVALVRGRGMLGNRSTHILACAAVAAVTAAGAASDKLLFPAGVAPFALTGLALAWLVPRPIGRRIALTAVGIAIFSVVGARVVVAAMEARHVYQDHFPITFATWEQLAPNVRILVQALASLFNGDFGGAKPSARSLLAFACAVAFLAGAVVAARAGRAWFADVLHRLESGRRDEAPHEAVRVAHVMFWLFASGLSAAVFVFSSVPQNGGGRYLLAAAYGVPVLVAVAAAGKGVWLRGAAILGACVVVSGSVVALAARDIRVSPSLQQFARLLDSFAAGEGLKYGYAAYWDATALTWETHMRVQVYPVESCKAEHGFCAFWFHQIGSWYTPRPATRTFLIVDRRYGPDNPGLRLGGTDETLNFGQYTIYVYDYDIAVNLGPPRYAASASPS